VTAAAVTAGVASVPTPITEVEWEGWLWHEFFSFHSPVATAGIGSAAREKIVIDSKAMRKVETQDVVILVMEAVVSGAASMTIMGQSRMLIKLP